MTDADRARVEAAGWVQLSAYEWGFADATRRCKVKRVREDHWVWAGWVGSTPHMCPVSQPELAAILAASRALGVEMGEAK